MATIQMKRIIVIVNLIMLTVVAGLAVNLFYDFLDARLHSASAAVIQKQAHAPTQSRETTQLAHFPLAYYQPVIKRDLFGIGGTEKVLAPEPEPTEGLERTDMNIKLWGTVTGKGSVKYAVIEARTDAKRMEQELYQEGDNIESATLEKILDNKVILNVKGTRQVLMLEKFEQKGRSSTYRQSARRYARSSRTPRTYRRTISSKMIENASKNFNQLLTQAKVIPQSDGMKITRIKGGSIFRRLGLRNGDVITSVNNRQVQSMNDAMNIYQSLKPGSKVSIQLRRRNQPRTIEYQVR